MDDRVLDGAQSDTYKVALVLARTVFEMVDDGVEEPFLINDVHMGEFEIAPKAVAMARSLSQQRPDAPRAELIEVLAAAMAGIPTGIEQSNVEHREHFRREKAAMKARLKARRDAARVARKARKRRK